LKLLFFPLIAAGFAGNWLELPLLVNASFHSGSIFALLAVHLLGASWGTVAAAAIASCTCVIWKHPYALIVMTAEAMVVSQLVERRKMGIIQADTIFWVAVGMPLSYLFCYLALKSPPGPSYYFATKLAVNAIANAMVARLILTCQGLWSRRSLTPLREAVFNLLALFVFCPVFAFFVLSSRRDFSEADKSIRQEIVQQSRNMNSLLMSWLESRKAILTTLSEQSKTEPPEHFNVLVKQAARSDPNYRQIELVDCRAAGAASRWSDRFDQKWFQEQLRGARIGQGRPPVVSEVSTGGPLAPEPVVALVTPAAADGAARTCIIGILSLKQLQGILKSSLDQQSTLYSVLDRQGRVILTNRPDQQVMAPYVQPSGPVTDLGHATHRWYPAKPKNGTVTGVWQQSTYLYGASLGDAGWELVMEQPLVPFRVAFYGNYSGKFTLLLLILLGSLAMAEILSKRVVVVLDQFNALTDGLPRRLMADGDPIVWPKNRVAEADHLINNFRHIAESLTPLYLQINQLNETLEERIAARTQELVKSQALTIDVVDSLRSSISVLDQQGVIIVVNEPWRRFARQNNGADSGYLGTNYLEVCRSSMWQSGSLPAASAFLGIRAVLEGERDHFEMEYACELPGETRWYQLIASKLTGSRLGAVVSHSDITSRKLAEEAVQASEMKHRLLFDSAGDGIFIVDRQSRILAANPLACHRLGYYDTELNQLSFGQIQSPGHGQLLPERMARLFQQGHLLYETVLMHKDGSPVPTEVNARGTFWNKEPAMMAICRDLTERKRAEEDLSEAKQFIEQVISCAQEGIVVCDLDLRYRGWNPYMEKLTGLPAEEVIGRHPAELFPEHVKAGLLEHLEAARCGAAKHDFDMVSVAATGEEYWTSSLSSQLLNTRGEVAGVITTVREITWRKQMEDETRQALESAEAANAGMQRLLRTVSHEFRTPLGLLTGCTDILDRHWDKLKPDQRRLQTGYIRNAAGQLTVLVDSVTSFNLAQAEQPDRAKRFDIGALCARIAADASAVWQAGHTFEVSIAPDCGTGQINDSLLRRVLENLLSNAFRYTPPKGTVTLQVSRLENRLHLAISDTGIGISEADQKYIFDQFYRGQNVDDRRGLGLGLAIVQEALAKLEGSIEITSCVHEGSAMRVAIPIAE